MKWIFSLLLLGLFPTKNTPTAHDFHISKCLIEYSEEAQAIQFSLHLFIDDVALALAEKHDGKLHLCTKLEVENAEIYLYQYLQENIQIQIDDKPLTINWIGKEPADDMEGMWCYLEVPNVGDFSTISITNELLTEVLDDQQNMVQVVVKKENLGQTLLHKQRTSTTFSVKNN